MAVCADSVQKVRVVKTCPLEPLWKSAIIGVLFLRATKRFKDGKVHCYWNMMENVRAVCLAVKGRQTLSPGGPLETGTDRPLSPVRPRRLRRHLHRPLSLPPSALLSLGSLTAAAASCQPHIQAQAPCLRHSCADATSSLPPPDGQRSACPRFRIRPPPPCRFHAPTLKCRTP